MNTFNLKIMQLALVLVATCWIPSVNAAVTYSYTGNLFDTIIDETPPAGSYNAGNFVSIEFTTPALLQNLNAANISPTSFTVSDGRNTIDNFGASGFPLPPLFMLTTDGAGDILFWTVSVAESGGLNTISSSFAIDSVNTGECLASSSLGCLLLVEDHAEVAGNPGTWTNDAPVVPVPAAAWLFGSAVLGLGALKRQNSQA